MNELETAHAIIAILLKRLWEFTEEDQVIEPRELDDAHNKYELGIDRPAGANGKLIVTALRKPPEVNFNKLKEVSVIDESGLVEKYIMRKAESGTILTDEDA